MMRRSPRPIHPISAAVVIAAAVGGYLIAHLLDGPVFRSLDWPSAARKDWHRMFRVMGYLPLWIVAGVVAARLHRPLPGEARRPMITAGFIVLSTAIAGLGAEAVKLAVRRMRPDEAEPGYHFRAFSVDPFSTSGLGMPSSHVAVAFAGATALCIIAPRAWFVWMLLAAGCAFTRLSDRAHWLSDAYVGALLGILVSWWLARVMRPGRSGALR